MKSRYVLALCLLSFVLSPVRAIGMQELGDSLTVWTGFSSIWSAPVTVKSMRVNGDKITLRTNPVLSGVRWTPALVRDVERNVSRWLLGHNKGKVTIYTNNHEIRELVTPCAKGNHKPLISGKSLAERNIALYPSHGLYFNRTRQQWIWQRAALWTTVEDLYSQEYVRNIRTMLENAGATIYMPRPGLEATELGASGMPQWTEGARYWLISQGADTTLWDLYEGDEYKDDMKCRAMWVNSLSEPIDLCLAFHTDGADSWDDSVTIGTLAIYTAYDDDGNKTLRDGRNRVQVNRNLADFIQTQVVNDLRHIAPEWTRRQLMEANYCESRVPVVPSLILELLSHKNMADMRYGLDPHFRQVAARAVYKGILRFLCGNNAVVQPLPVHDLAFSLNGEIRWQPALDSIEPTAKPTHYFLYVRENDGEWTEQRVSRPQAKIDMQPGVRYDCYVVAANDGGRSLPSHTLSAYQSPITHNPSPVTHNPSPVTHNPSPVTLHPSPITIIDAFDDVYGVEWFADSLHAGIVPGSFACEDRFSCAYIGEQYDFLRTNAWLNDDNCGWGSCYRDHAGQLTVGNTADYAVQHGRALQRLGISYSSCTKAYAVNRPYGVSRSEELSTVIDFISGRQRQPLDSAAYALLSRHLDNGGRLLLSTDHFSAIDPDWAKQYLHASLRSTKGTRCGQIILNNFQLSTVNCHPSPFTLSLRPNSERLCSPSPEGLLPTDSLACRFAWYPDSRTDAAIGYQSAITNQQSPITNHQSPITNHQSPITLTFSFPLEAAQDFDFLYSTAILWLCR